MLRQLATSTREFGRARLSVARAYWSRAPAFRVGVRVGATLGACVALGTAVTIAHDRRNFGDDLADCVRYSTLDSVRQRYKRLHRWDPWLARLPAALTPRPPLVAWHDLEMLACESQCVVEATVHMDGAPRLLADCSHSHRMLELVHNYTDRDAETADRFSASTTEPTSKLAANWRALAAAIQAGNTLNVRILARRYRAQFRDFLEHGPEAADAGRTLSADQHERDAWRALTRASPQCVGEVSEALSERDRPLLVARLLYQAASDGDAVIQCGRCTVVKCYWCRIGDKTTRADVSLTPIQSQSFSALLVTPPAAAAAPDAANRAVGTVGATASSASEATASRTPLRLTMTNRELADVAFHVVVLDALGTIVAKSARDPALLATIETVVAAYMRKTMPEIAAAIRLQDNPWLSVVVSPRQLELAAASGNLGLLKRMHAARSIRTEAGVDERLWQAALQARQVPITAWLARETLNIVEPPAPEAAPLSSSSPPSS